MNDVKVIAYESRYKDAYVNLNIEWISTHFWIEEMDLAQLKNPEKTILEGGGEIFFVLENGRPVGTCAMVPHGPSCYELAKMAVEPGHRGKGYGDLLMAAAINWAKEK